MTVLPAVILAAGESSRMGRPKALLPVAGGEPFVARIARVLGEGGAGPLLVVTRAELAVALQSAVPGAAIVVNPDPARGQLSSLQCALAALGQDPAAVIVTLADVPLVSPETVRSLIGAWRTSRAPLVWPSHRGRHGHPVVFAPPLLEALRTADPAPGARPVVRRFAPSAVTVEVADAAVLLDVDTPGEYDRLIQGSE